MTPQEYMQCALRTLYPDLTQSERLGLCGLGLSGEIGEVTDLLKKFLYHRNGKPLDMEKLKDELGDVLWYFFVLLDTLGLTFEAVMEANAAKLEERHPSGFNPTYASDSHASEQATLHTNRSDPSLIVEMTYVGQYTQAHLQMVRQGQETLATLKRRRRLLHTQEGDIPLSLDEAISLLERREGIQQAPEELQSEIAVYQKGIESIEREPDAYILPEIARVWYEQQIARIRKLLAESREETHP